MIACPNCEHKMNCVALSPAVFWCPRCGTLKTELGGGKFETPMIVGCARAVMPHSHAHAVGTSGDFNPQTLLTQFIALAECMPPDIRDWYGETYKAAIQAISITMPTSEST